MVSHELLLKSKLSAVITPFKLFFWQGLSLQTAFGVVAASYCVTVRCYHSGTVCGRP